MDLYLLIKWVHILSSTILFGFGAGTAWYFWNAHLTHDPATISSIGRMVVWADWMFTGITGILQPASGIVLARLAGHELTESWLVVSYFLYLIAFTCWVPVVWLQIKVQRMAQAAVDTGAPLGPEYRRTTWLWFALGWPAFLGLLGVFWLMVAKPSLW
jgi:uncharacterized membrane protein